MLPQHSSWTTIQWLLAVVSCIFIVTACGSDQLSDSTPQAVTVPATISHLAVSSSHDGSNTDSTSTTISNTELNSSTASPLTTAASLTTATEASPLTTAAEAVATTLKKPQQADPQQTIVGFAIGQEITAFESIDGQEIVRFSNPTSRGGPLAFRATGRQNQDWIEVYLPLRPNGSTGWVKRSELNLSTNPYRVEIRLDEFELELWRSDELLIETTVAVGTTSTPTPTGDFYIIELLKPSNPNGAYGPFAYGLSGFSNALMSFNGGEGVIGIHGTNQPELLGSRVSHGCIRIPNDQITAMADLLPLGTPVLIH